MLQHYENEIKESVFSYLQLLKLENNTVKKTCVY